MKLNKSKEWYADKFAKEGTTEVGVGLGFPSARLDFNKFVELWRRGKGWSAEQLAEAAELEVEDILNLEEDRTEVQPSVMKKLAKLFKLDIERLMLLVGASETCNLVKEDETRYGERSVNRAALTYEEHEALEEALRMLR